MHRATTGLALEIPYWDGPERSRNAKSCARRRPGALALLALHVLSLCYFYFYFPSDTLALTLRCRVYAKVSFLLNHLLLVGAVADQCRTYPETSKRVSINQREKIKKKVRDARKKKGKEAKKNVQWKSSMCLPVFCSCLHPCLCILAGRAGGGEGKG